MAEIGGLPQKLENSDQTYSEIATINRRMNLLENRLRNIIDKLTSKVYTYTTRGLFQQHILIFSL